MADDLIGGRRVDAGSPGGDNGRTDTTLRGQQEAIRTRHEFAAFVEALRSDLVEHPESWESVNLEAYLDALVALTWRAHRPARQRGRAIPTERPTWRMVGRILLDARIYKTDR